MMRDPVTDSLALIEDVINDNLFEHLVIGHGPNERYWCRCVDCKQASAEGDSWREVVHDTECRVGRFVQAFEKL